MTTDKNTIIFMSTTADSRRSKTLYKNLWYLPTDTIDSTIHTIAFCLNTIVRTNPGLGHRLSLLKRAVPLIRALPERLDWHYHQTLINELDVPVYEIAEFKKEIDRIIDICQTRMSGSPAEYEYIPSLYLALYKKGYRTANIHSIINDLAQRTQDFDRQPLLELCVACVKQKDIPSRASQIAHIGVNSSVEFERDIATTLHTLLVT